MSTQAALRALAHASACTAVLGAKACQHHPCSTVHGSGTSLCRSFAGLLSSDVPWGQDTSYVSRRRMTDDVSFDPDAVGFICLQRYAHVHVPCCAAVVCPSIWHAYAPCRMMKEGFWAPAGGR